MSKWLEDIVSGVLLAFIIVVMFHLAGWVHVQLLEEILG